MMLLVLVEFAFANCTPIDVGNVRVEVTAAVDADQLPVALARLQAVWNALPGACAPTSAEDMGWLAYTAAAFALETNASVEAERWVDVALTDVPAVPVPAALGVGVKEVVDRHRPVIEALPRAGVIIEVPVVLDGVLLSPGASVDPLTTGSHLVMWQESGGWRGSWFSLEEGRPLLLPSREPVPTPAPVARKKSTGAAPVVLVASGAVVAAGGVAWLVAGSAMPYNEQCPFDAGAGVEGLRQCDATHGLSTELGYFGGLGLIVGGAALGVAGIGVGVLVSGDHLGLSFSVPL